MKGRRQEANILAQEEGLGLSSFFEFQAFAMLDYLRMKSAYNLPAKDTMTTVLINTSYIFIAHGMRSVFSYLFPRATVTLS